MKLTRLTALVAVPMCGLCSIVCAPAFGHGYRVYKTSIAVVAENSTFTAGEAIIRCKTAEFTFIGLVGPAAAILLTPAYKEC